MSSVTIIQLIILINHIYQTITINQCNLLNPIDLQSATYTHSLILRVEPTRSSDSNETTFIVNKMIVREIIKISTINYHNIKIDDIILIRIDNNVEDILDDMCWYLLPKKTVDLILFLNETDFQKEFDLRYPPMESTLYVREQIDAVLNQETYSPKVIIKTEINRPVLFNSYTLQCNARGNPLPRLSWSKNDQNSEYIPSMKDCKPSCRIYSSQTEYQSILYFEKITMDDSGIYVCHAENAINYTMTSVYLDVDHTNIINHQPNINVTCATLKYCHRRGQCITVNNQWKCLCDNEYIGEQCETNYVDIIKKQDNTILLFKSRLLAGGILILIFVILLFISCISCIHTRNKDKKRRQRRRQRPVSKTITNGTVPKPESVERLNQTQQSVPMPIIHRENHRPILTKDSATITTNCNNDCCSLKMNNIRDSNIETTTTNDLILSEGYLEFYRPDAQSGLIRPLAMYKNSTKYQKKFIPSQNRFISSQSVD